MANVTDRFRYTPDRDRGILTPRDRRFLLGDLDDELDDNAKRQKRHRLRKRMFHAIQDLAYLRLMSTRDVGQVGDRLLENYTPERVAEGDPDPIDLEAQRRMERLGDASDELIALIRELFHPNFFRFLVSEQLATRAALDHYDAKGEFGCYDVEITTTLKDRVSIEELASDPDSVGREYPGWFQVLDRHGVEEVDMGYDSPPVEHPDLVDDAVEIMKSLDDGEAGGVAVSAVVERLCEDTDLTPDEAQGILREALMDGQCYEPAEGYIRAV